MRPKILLIGDDSVEVEKIQTSLQRAGFLVAVAPPTRTGLRLAKTQRPALAVLSLNGTSVNLAKFGQSLRRALETRPLILIPPEDAEVLEAENQTVLERPASTRRILYHVRRTFKEHKPASLTLGDLTLDYENRCVWNGGERSDLTPMQFKLLEFFMMRPGQALSKREIMQAVWETSYVGDVQTLYVHVCWLRNKLRTSSSKGRYIQTVRGIGYTFDPSQDCEPDA